MNDSELEGILRSTRAPERTEEYWEEFPGRVLSRLPRRQWEAPTKDPWLAAAAWGSALALACVMIGFGIGHSDRQIFSGLLRREQNFRRELTVVPKQFCAMIQSERRLRYLVADSPQDL
jgi:hypothetical protein